ncbi:glucose-6-phosphate isomerase [Mobilisporobacter senegalensis]|uniref:glucose-6-phosphate isomerase n=1 Tax=Mobilisporobacter senegalensis TaxID=1329262 RepID=A0A3N1X5U8_9FIRM|nr:glucose-6-phosphate isomerase family protein [Mobilisporobacter senegalensis]ROR22160.1 glucose-6-phosphate isomerase [Mobilisporobacter senegalensis]
MEFNPGFDIEAKESPLNFQYGDQVFGAKPELRTIDAVRKSLKNPFAKGPKVLYCISMDVGEKKDLPLMKKRNLLFGAVTYAAGVVGDEPVRSQGHIHAISSSCNDSTCEVYEIWDGEAYIYMQESGKDDAGECYGVHAKAGDVVIVPPGWVHATVNGNIHKNMTFGAWCVRDYGFDYEDVRAHNGIAFFPIVKDDEIVWEFNKKYSSGNITIKEAREYPEFEIEKGKPIYTQFQENPDKFLFVSKPAIAKEIWESMKI